MCNHIWLYTHKCNGGLSVYCLKCTLNSTVPYNTLVLDCVNEEEKSVQVANLLICNKVEEAHILAKQFYVKIPHNKKK